MKIYLIGMPGSGKSTVGKKLAHKLGIKFIDTDKVIEKEENRKISEIFSTSGEIYFRDLESKKLLELMPLDNVLISTGGGVVVRSKNQKLMNGLIIFLDTNPMLLKRRLELSKNRPLLNSYSVDYLYKNRIESYRKFSNLRIMLNRNDSTFATKEIIALLKKEEVI